MKAPSKWLLLFLLFLLGALALGWTLFGAFTSKDYEKLSAAYQAFFAYTGIFPALAALLVAFQSETRATQADARALASETEANQVRQAALLQAQATHDLATATREQSAILQLQEARTTAATLVLVHTGGFGVNANFSLINLSTQNMFIYGVRQLDSKGIWHETKVGEGKVARGLRHFDEQVFLAPGDSSAVHVDNAIREDLGEDQLGNRIINTLGLESIKTVVRVKFLYAPTGSAYVMKDFKVDYHGDASKIPPLIVDEQPQFALFVDW